MTIRSAACAPSDGGASTRCAHFSSACGRGSHECGGAAADSVDTYVSSKILRKLKNFATREPTILMGGAPACQRTRAYATFALLSAATRASRRRMEFGLLPKFSTPVQKPVENGVLRRTDFKNRHIHGHFLKAKVRRARFEAILGVPPIVRSVSAVLR